MLKRGKQRIITWVLALVMLTNVFLPLNVAQAADVDISVLPNLVVEVTQNGNPIPEGGTLTSTDPIQVKISFGVPVEGDGLESKDAIHWEDTVELLLSKSFRFDPEPPGSIELKFKEKNWGRLH